MRLYHWVPENLEGSVLYPLNDLREKYPHLYRQHVQKYEGRKQVIEHRIPTLGCMWNDVLFFSPIPPHALHAACADTGIVLARGVRYFEIDPYRLDPSRTTVWLHTDDSENADEYVAYDPANLGQYAEVPEETKIHYREHYAQGLRPLIFKHVPHILYQGSLDISTARIIEP